MSLTKRVKFSEKIKSHLHNSFNKKRKVTPDSNNRENYISIKKFRKPAAKYWRLPSSVWERVDPLRHQQQFNCSGFMAPPTELEPVTT